MVERKRHRPGLHHAHAPNAAKPPSTGSPGNSGAFKATSFAALDVETFLLPIERQIEKNNVGVLGRILSSNSLDGVLSAQRTGEFQRRRDKYIGPLENIRRCVRNHGWEEMNTLEQVPAFFTPPWWQGSRIYIDQAEEAYSRCEQAQNEAEYISIYTDESSVDSHVGAAAVCPATGRSKSTYLGSSSSTTNHLAELQGINLALNMAQDLATDSSTGRQVAIWSDSQAAVRSLGRSEGRSGAQISMQIRQRVQSLQERGHAVTVRWIPSHKSILGNAEADNAAKQATGWRSGGATGPRANQLEDLRQTLT